jgi:hypothetical protein
VCHDKAVTDQTSVLFNKVGPRSTYHSLLGRRDMRAASRGVCHDKAVTVKTSLLFNKVGPRSTYHSLLGRSILPRSFCINSRSLMRAERYPITRVPLDIEAFEKVASQHLDEAIVLFVTQKNVVHLIKGQS